MTHRERNILLNMMMYSREDIIVDALDAALTVGMLRFGAEVAKQIENEDAYILLLTQQQTAYQNQAANYQPYNQGLTPYNQSGLGYNNASNQSAQNTGSNPFTGLLGGGFGI